MEKFGLSIKNLNNLWSFIKVYAVFVPNLCREKSAQKKSMWRKNDKYGVCFLTELLCVVTTEEDGHKRYIVPYECIGD